MPFADSTEADEETASSLRPLLFSIAYRMTGSTGDAEDLAQEALLRLYVAERDGALVRSRRSFASTVVSRLAIDHLRSARVQRDEYVGQWLPEPILTPRGSSPEDDAELADSVSLAFLVVLESLSPPERAAFLLHDVLGYEFADVARIIEKSEDNTRQIASRARRALADRRPRFNVDPGARWELADRFFEAVKGGEAADLICLLGQEAVLYGDGGGIVPTNLDPVTDQSSICKILLSAWQYAKHAGHVPVPAEVNGDPGLVLIDESGNTQAVVALEIERGEVRTIRSIVNPNKLENHAWLKSAPTL